MEKKFNKNEFLGLFSVCATCVFVAFWGHFIGKQPQLKYHGNTTSTQKSRTESFSLNFFSISSNCYKRSLHSAIQTLVFPLSCVTDAHSPDRCRRCWAALFTNAFLRERTKTTTYRAKRRKDRCLDAAEHFPYCELKCYCRTKCYLKESQLVLMGRLTCHCPEVFLSNCLLLSVHNSNPFLQLRCNNPESLINCSWGRELQQTFDKLSLA